MKQKVGRKTYTYPKHSSVSIRMENDLKDNFNEYCDKNTYNVCKRIKWLMRLDMEGKLKNIML